MQSKSILQIGLTYRFQPFVRLKEQNNLLEFPGLAEVREPTSIITPSVPRSAQKNPTNPKPQMREEMSGGGLIEFLLTPGVNST